MTATSAEERLTKIARERMRTKEMKRRVLLPLTTMFDGTLIVVLMVFRIDILNIVKALIKGDFERGLSYYILEHDGEPRGCVALEKASPDVCYLERLAVLPQHRRKGYGRILVKHIFEEASRNGSQRVEIGIIARDTKLRNWSVHHLFS